MASTFTVDPVLSQHLFRYLWDGVCSQRRQVAKIDEQTEILQYVTPSPSGFTDRDHCLLRAWEYDPTSETHVIVSTSVSHPSASLMAGIRATELATRYTIERVDREKTRVSFICRVDMRYVTAWAPTVVWYIVYVVIFLALFLILCFFSPGVVQVSTTIKDLVHTWHQVWVISESHSINPVS